MLSWYSHTVHVRLSSPESAHAGVWRSILLRLELCCHGVEVYKRYGRYASIKNWLKQQGALYGMLSNAYA